MSDFFADNGRPITFTALWAALVASLTQLLPLFFVPEAVTAIIAFLSALGPLIGFFIPRRSVARKAEMQAAGVDPVSKLGKPKN